MTAKGHKVARVAEKGRVAILFKVGWKWHVWWSGPKRRSINERTFYLRPSADKFFDFIVKKYHLEEKEIEK